VDEQSDDESDLPRAHLRLLKQFAAIGDLHEKKETASEDEAPVKSIAEAFASKYYDPPMRDDFDDSTASAMSITPEPSSRSQAPPSARDGRYLQVPAECPVDNSPRPDPAPSAPEGPLLDLNLAMPFEKAPPPPATAALGVPLGKHLMPYNKYWQGSMTPRSSPRSGSPPSDVLRPRSSVKRPVSPTAALRAAEAVRLVEQPQAPLSSRRPPVSQPRAAPVMELGPSEHDPSRVRNVPTRAQFPSVVIRPHSSDRARIVELSRATAATDFSAFRGAEPEPARFNLSGSGQEHPSAHTVPERGFAEPPQQVTADWHHHAAPEADRFHRESFVNRVLSTDSRASPAGVIDKAGSDSLPGVPRRFSTQEDAGFLL
jgi:hypothetical protein